MSLRVMSLSNSKYH